MAEKVNPCRALCGCLACLGLIFALLGILAILAMMGGFLLVLEDIRPCNAIAKGQPYIIRMDNVTLKQGSAGELECRIINSDLLEDVYFFGAKFEAMIGHESRHPTIIKAQKGVDVNVGFKSNEFNCQAEPKFNATISTTVKTLTMYFFPVTILHEGWYYCSANVTLPGKASQIIGHRAYVSMK